MSDDPKILGFPKAEEVPPEERARRLKVEVDAAGRLPGPSGCTTSSVTGVAEKHGIARPF